jgi:very-short-patch-repair endonuclease
VLDRLGRHLQIKASTQSKTILRYGYFQSISRDVKKEDWLEKNGFTLLTIEYDEVGDLTETFIKEKFDISL